MKKSNTSKNLAKYQFLNVEELAQKSWHQPKKIDPLLNRNCLCDICSQVGGLLGDVSLPCIYCNVIVHFSCLYKTIRKPSSLEEAIKLKDSFICFYCFDSLDNSLDVFEEEKNTATKFKTLNNAQTIISKNWRRYVERKRFTRIYSLILHIQLWFRLNKRKTLFLEKRYVKLRPLRVKIIKCDNIPIIKDKLGSSQTNNPHHNNKNHDKTKPPSTASNRETQYEYFVIVSVIDLANGNHNQRWLVTTDFTESPLVKPTTMTTSISFNSDVMLPGVSGNQTIVLSVFQKGVKKPYFFGQVFVDISLNFIWKRGGLFSLKLDELGYALKDKTGMELKADFSFKPMGTIDFELIPTHGMYSECGNVLASSVDDYIRCLNRLPDFNGFEVYGLKPEKNVSSGFNFNAPILMKKLWIAIVDSQAFVYSNFGETLKLIINLKYFDFSAETNNTGTIYTIHKFGYPNFKFSSYNNNDYIRWSSVFLACMRYAKDPTAPFDIKLLLEDMKKYNFQPVEGKKNASIKVKRNKISSKTKRVQVANDPQSDSGSDDELKIVNLKFSTKNSFSPSAFRERLKNSVMKGGFMGVINMASASKQNNEIEDGAEEAVMNQYNIDPLEGTI